VLEAAAGVEPAIEILQTSALTTWLRRPGVGVPDNDERQTTEHIASVLCLTPRREIGAGEGTRTLDLLHGKQTL
jgi:hypothetical protein